MALADEPLDHGVSGAQVHDVELVHPRGDEEHRPAPDRLGGRRVLDELDEIVLKDYLARRGRDGLADREGVRRAHAHVEPTGLRVQVTDELPHALDGTRPSGFEGGPDRFRVRREEVRRSQCIRHLPDGEPETAPAGLVEPRDFVRQCRAGARVGEIRLLQYVEPWDVVPGVVTEAAVVVVRTRYRLRIGAGHAGGAVRPQRAPRLSELDPGADEGRGIGREARPEPVHGIVQAQGVEQRIAAEGAVAPSRCGSRHVRRAIHPPRSPRSCGVLRCARVRPRFSIWPICAVHNIVAALLAGNSGGERLVPAWPIHLGARASRPPGGERLVPAWPIHLGAWASRPPGPEARNGRSAAGPPMFKRAGRPRSQGRFVRDSARGVQLGRSDWRSAIRHGATPEVGV